MIDSNTSIYGLIGKPIEHSISPQIQNAAYQQMGLNAVYVSFKISTSAASAVKSFSRLGVSGINVTIPYKTEVIPALDEIEPLAGKVGAVNTIRFGSKISGFNTDVSASMRCLEEGAQEELRGTKVTMVGAGGAARAVAFGLASEKADLTICNRTVDKAVCLAEEISSKTGWPKVRGRPYTREELEKELAQSSVLINATPVGMHPRTEGTIVESDMLNHHLAVMDLVYNPPETKLLRQARKAGCRTIGGLSMLIYQAADSIQIWTGREPDTEVMFRRAEEALDHFGSKRGHFNKNEN